MSMYAGTNATAIRSMNDLSNAMFSLLKKYDFSEITITMICQEAQISRQTFYKLFDDKKEVIHNLISLDYKAYLSGISTNNSESLTGFTEYTLLFFWEKKELIDLLIRQKLDYIFLEEVQDKLSKVISLFTSAPFLNNKAIYNFFTGGLSSMILYQVGYDQKENVGSVAQEFSKILGNPKF